VFQNGIEVLRDCNPGAFQVLTYLDPKNVSQVRNRIFDSSLHRVVKDLKVDVGLLA
ncbi:MAG: hypothetical protein GTO49_01210, partial [Anaerolineae bacterium]|nr:hypothetical protein [Anaerolineae bacterium]